MHKLFTTLCAAAVSLAAVALPSGSFKPQNGKLYDANGNEFMMRGVNYSWAWQAGNEYSVIPAAKRIGCNTIRIQLGDGNSRNSGYKKPSTTELENLIKLCEDNKLVAMFNFHNETGRDEVSHLEFAANAWTQYKDVLNAHQSTVLVNITNEWYGKWSQLNNWADAYKSVIPKMRQNGIKNTLVVDAAGWGQCINSIAVYASDIAAADPDKNTIFSMHFYQDAAGDESTAKRNMDNAIASGTTVIIGEIAYRHQGKDVAWQAVLDYAKEKGMGWLGWSWTGNSSDVADCDMFASYDDSQYKQNGTNLVKGRNGIAQTSVECSVFGGGVNPNPPTPDPEPTPTPSGDMDIMATHNVNQAGSWDNEIVIPASLFQSADANSTVRLHMTSGGQMQFATKLSPNWTWTQFNEYTDVAAPHYDLKISAIPSMGKGVSTTTALDGLKFAGLVIKGQDFYLTKAELLKPSGITDVKTDINWDEPVEIFNLQGIAVAEPTPGQIYIVRQGTAVKKVVF